MIKRIELLVYMNYKASLIELFKEKGANVEYVNKRAGYAVLYVGSDKIKALEEELKHTKGIKKFERSQNELLELDI